MKKRIKTLNYGNRAVYINSQESNKLNYYLASVSLSKKDNFSNETAYAVLNKDFIELIPFDLNNKLMSIISIDENKFIAVFCRKGSYTYSREEKIYQFYEIKDNKIINTFSSGSEIQFVNNKIIGTEYQINDFDMKENLGTFIYDMESKNKIYLPDVKFKEFINENIICFLNFKSQKYFLYDLKDHINITKEFNYITGMYDEQHTEHPQIMYYVDDGRINEQRVVKEKQIIEIILANVNLNESKSRKNNYELIAYLDINLNYIMPIYDTLNDKFIDPNEPDFDLEKVIEKFLASAYEKDKNRKNYLALKRSKIGS